MSSGLSTENSIQRVGNTVKLSSNYEEYKEQFFIIAFLSFMEPLVDKYIEAIKNYIVDYYNTNGLTFVLLVGDYAQVISQCIVDQHQTLVM